MEDDKIEFLLDKNGKGILTEELNRIFVANGCEPECHICEKAIKVGDKLHLKTFFSKIIKEDIFEDGTQISYSVDPKGETTSSIEIMICIKCSDNNRKLPKIEMERMLVLAKEHNLVEENIEKLPNMGTIQPPRDYSHSSSGYSSRSGGCMIVCKNNKINIVS